MRHTLQNGTIVEWQRDDCFSGYHIEIVESSIENKGCGNPWNLMNKEESARIKKTRPQTSPPPCNIESILKQSILTKTEMRKELEETISADCWGVFVTTYNRDQVAKVYFDNRNSEDKSNDDTIRERLMNDCSELMEHIENFDTVVVVMGGESFMEFYFTRMVNYNKNNQLDPIYLMSYVDHSINW